MIPLFKVLMSPTAKAAVSAVLDSGYVGQGPRVDEFEAELSKHLSGESLDSSVVTTNSCTSALGLALDLIGVEPGDEVISTPMTCTATNGAIVNRRAKIVWADVDSHSGLIDPKDVERKLTPKTKAIMAVDWAGTPCDYASLRQHGIPVIEDAAHAFLATISGHSLAETGGDYVTYSFGPIKHLCCVDGGALIPPEGQVDRARLLRWHGLDRRSTKDFRCSQSIVEAGTKCHMTDVNAVIGLANLQLALDGVEQHRENASFYHRELCEVKGIGLAPFDRESAYWLFCILTERRDTFIEFMAEKGIHVSPVHARNDTHPAYNFPNGILPGVDAFSRSEAAIPVGWWLTEEERQHVVDSVKEWAKIRIQSAWAGIG